MVKRLLPIGQQSLPDMINGGFIYIDKTQHIYELVKAKGYYFLSRPRRFGKTLLVSTMEEIFQGNRELFKDLAIASMEYSWEKYPVIVISFATMAPRSATVLRQALDKTIEQIAERYGVEIDDEPTLGMKFKSLILKLAHVNNVVILIDEYDAAILKNIEDYETANECGEVLSEFFSALKDVEVDKKLRFVFITGISKFSKTSIFSGMNNLQDLSLDSRAARLLGYTSQEIRVNYKEYLAELSQLGNTSVDETLAHIQFWYNGYQFVDPSVVKDAKVYNPYSVMLYLQNGLFDNYWFDTGTPSFLMRFLRKQQYPISSIEGAWINKSQTKSYDIKDVKLLPLLWQAGYLTVKSYDSATKNFQLMFPNEEVRVSFFEHVIESITEIDPAYTASVLSRLSQALLKGDLDSFFETLQVFFAQIPYDLSLPFEKYYQSIFFTIMSLLGAQVRAEERTNNGRIDAMVETPSSVYIFEFKLNGSAEDALSQIEEKEYFKKYQLVDKPIVMIGVQFDKDKRTVEKWVSKECA